MLGSRVRYRHDLAVVGVDDHAGVAGPQLFPGDVVGVEDSKVPGYPLDEVRCGCLEPGGGVRVDRAVEHAGIDLAGVGAGGTVPGVVLAPELLFAGREHAVAAHDVHQAEYPGMVAGSGQALTLEAHVFHELTWSADECGASA